MARAMLWNLLLLVLVCTKSSFATDKNVNPTNLPEIDVNFTEFESLGNYETQINGENLGAIYELTNSFIKAVISDSFPEDLILVDDNGNIEIKDDDYMGIIIHYKSLFIFLIFLVIFAILMPVIGIIFGCCRCCGVCGGNQHQVESSDNIWTIIYIACFIIFGAMFIFGLVGVFETNERVEGGIKGLVPTVRRSVNDIETYFNESSGHINLLLIDNFAPLSSALINRLDKTGDLLYDEFQVIVNPIVIQGVLDTLQGLENVKNNMNMVTQTNDDLMEEIDKTNLVILAVKENTRNVLFDIRDSDKLEDPAIKESIEKILLDLEELPNIQWDLSHEPDFGIILTALSELFRLGIITSVQNGLDELMNLPDEIMQELDVYIEEVKKGIKQTGDEIETQSTEALNSVKEIVDTITTKSDQYLNDADRFLNDYGGYRYYPDLVVCLVLLAIIIFIIIGLIFGMVFKQPSSKSECCNAKMGSTCLMVSVSIMFITSILLVIIIIIHMLGMVAQVGACEPLKDPNLEIMKFLDNFPILQDVVDVTISSVIKECYADQSIFNVFNLEKVIDLEEISNLIETSGIKVQIAEIIEEIQTITIPPIINNELITALTGLSESPLPLDQFEDIEQLPNEVVNKTQFRSISDALLELLSVLNPDDFNDNMKIIEEMRLAINNDVIEEQNSINTLIKTIKDNGKDAKEGLGNDGEFKNAIIALKNTAVDVNTNLQRLPTFLHDTAEDFTDQIINVIDTYLKRVVRDVRDNVGKCGPLANAFKGTIAGACDDILYPVNGFWFSLFWCILLFVPMIIISVNMASIFKSIKNQNIKKDDNKSKKQKSSKNKKSKPDDLEAKFNYLNSPPDYLDERQIKMHSEINDELERRYKLANKTKNPEAKKQVYKDIDDELERRFQIYSGRNEIPTRTNYGDNNWGYVPDDLERRYTISNPSNRPDFGGTRF